MSVTPRRDGWTMGGDPKPRKREAGHIVRDAPNPGGPARGAPDAVRFADTARLLGAEARERGLTVPAFRCPPRVPGVMRSVRRYPGGAVVSVVLRERSFAEVAADMVEGVVVVNRLDGDAAAGARDALRTAAGLPSSEARVVERHTRAA